MLAQQRNLCGIRLSRGWACDEIAARTAQKPYSEEAGSHEKVDGLEASTVAFLSLMTRGEVSPFILQIRRMCQGVAARQHQNVA
jgi:hypothetical protein